MTTNYALKTDIPTTTSDLTNDSDYTTKDYVDDSINNINTDLTTNYALKTDIPTKSSQLINDDGYIMSGKDSNDNWFITRIEIVDEIPTTEEDGVLYIIKE